MESCNFYTDEHGFVLFSQKEIRNFEKHNPTLNAIMRYVNDANILPNKFVLCGKGNRFSAYNDGCPIKILFGKNLMERVCAHSNCYMYKTLCCCAERTYKEMTEEQDLFDYSVLLADARIARLEKIYIPHNGIKVV